MHINTHEVVHVAVSATLSVCFFIVFFICHGPHLVFLYACANIIEIWYSNTIPENPGKMGNIKLNLILGVKYFIYINYYGRYDRI